MRKILLISHGNLAKGMYETLQLFVSDMGNISYITAYVDGKDAQKELSSFWDGIQEEDVVIIVSDILGGSTNQLVYPYIHRKNTYIFTGMNLPMVLQIVCMQDVDSADIIEEAKKGIAFMNDFVLERELDDE